VFDELRDAGLGCLVLWPYDEGGCACSECWPWGAKGYLSISRDLVAEARKRLPACEVVLSTWCFENEDDRNPDGEWAGLAAELAKDRSWVDYVMADGHNEYFPEYLLEHGVPGGLPLVNFPEISMFGMTPWGGYGANPAPAHFQRLWDRIKHMAAGGAPYSEGIYEDMNKVLVAGFYWDPDRPAADTLREYLAFVAAPEVADELMEVVAVLEHNHRRTVPWPDALGYLQDDRADKDGAAVCLHGEDKIAPDAARGLAVADLIDRRLTEAARRSWRWRILYLRALIDKELHERDGRLEGRALRDAFAELTRIYHAEQVHSKPLKPPQIAERQEEGA